MTTNFFHSERSEDEVARASLPVYKHGRDGHDTRISLRFLARCFTSFSMTKGLLAPNELCIFSEQLYILVETVAPGHRAGRD